jgi:putative acyl-CoA dehydrogenase
LLQASLLLRTAPTPVADAFVNSRLGDGGGRSYGTLPAAVASAAIIERAWPL